MGLHPEVVDAIKRAGFERPSAIQADAIPEIVAGKVTVVAAETGSGKTLAYLAPVVSKVIAARAARARDADAPGEARRYVDGVQALVLCPTGVLCEQVLGVLQALQGPDGTPLVSSLRYNASTYAPEPVEVAVTTPAALLAHMEELYWSEHPRAGGRGNMLDGMLSAVRTVVMDEADALLQGSEAKSLDRLLEKLRLGDRRRRQLAAMAELQVTEDQIQSLPLRARQTMNREGPKALLKLLGKSGKATGEEPFYWERQLVFAGATMPHTGKRGVVEMVLRDHPEAVWVNGAELHRSKADVRHRWLQVAAEHWEEALEEAVRSGPPAEGKTMVFVNGKGAADRAHDVLRRAGVDCVLYRGGLPARDAALAMEQFRAGSGGLMVCTDSAARGVDVPGVVHVVQGQFANTAIDFIHRIGRTARAGSKGWVTSLYAPDQAQLAETIKLAVEAGRPVEKAFSRKRSFRKKIRKFGMDTVRDRVLEEGATIAEELGSNRGARRT
ncbi:unnamed protein product [Pedinophyceae sp. YPF-701]|nr:unnamed protein product [Pedinophyceae sp. YPF-701]